jgi:hypothetical protein
VSEASDEVQSGVESTEAVEVRVHRVRRRRTEPPAPATPPPPNVRNWLIYAALATLVAALMFEGHLSHKPRHPPLPELAEATDVRSSILPANDSLQLVVSWDLTLAMPQGQPDSIRVKVVPALGNDSLIEMRPATVFADTAFLRAPARGQTLTGSSCVAAQHPDQPLTEICTPWQYVRPTTIAEVSVAAPQTIVIQPSGLQVDHDAGGKCAAWQRAHPGQSVWIAVNRVAIRECTGVNGKPTVTQFCAFAVLPGGRKVKTANSANNRYCDELFVEWAREKYS